MVIAPDKGAIALKSGGGAFIQKGVKDKARQFERRKNTPQALAVAYCAVLEGARI